MTSPFKRRGPPTPVVDRNLVDPDFNPVKILPLYELSPPSNPKNPPKFKYTVVQLHRIIDGFSLSNDSALNFSRGYISLMNLYKEMKDVPQTFKPYGGKKRKKGKYNKPAKLLEKNQDRFVPTAYAKNVGLYDEKSEEAFKLEINRLLNRLTTTNIISTFEEMKTLMKTESHQEYLAYTIADKAMKEHVFSGLYAKFVADCTSPMVQQAVVSAISTKFYDWCDIQKATENDSHYCNGSAKFFAALVNFQIITYEDGIDACQRLLIGLEKPELPAHIVEMLISFIQDCGSELIKKISKKMWDQFDKVLLRTDVQQRLMCLLKDVDEIRHEVLHGVKPVRAAVASIPDKNDEHMFIIRDSLINYQEGEDAKIDLPFPDFIRAASDLFPDQTNDSETFCSYICDIIDKMKPNTNNIVVILSQCANEYKKNNIECDSPKMWGLFDDLLYNMLLRQQIGVEDVRAIMTEFPIQHCNDVVNGMKWYLLDHHNFNTPINLETFPSLEIRDALMMPKIIDQPFPGQFPMSRLVAIAVLRAICYKVCEKENLTIKDLMKWKPFFEITIEKQPKAFNEEMVSLISYYEFPFSADEVYRACTQK